MGQFSIICPYCFGRVTVFEIWSIISSAYCQKRQSPLVFILNVLWLLFVDSFFLINFMPKILFRRINFTCQILLESFAFGCGGIWELLTLFVVLIEESPSGVNFHATLSSMFVIGTRIAFILFIISSAKTCTN